MNRNRVRFVVLTSFLVLAPASSWSIPVDAQEGPLLDSLVAEMEGVFSETRGMVDHTRRVHDYAVEIQVEEGGDPFIVRASAIFHDIGIPKAREVHGSSSGQFQEIEGPPIARDILDKYSPSPGSIDHICGIIANHHSDRDPEIVETIEFKILWDADWLVNFPNRHRDSTAKEKEEAIEAIFKTGKGREMAREMFLG